MGLELAEDQQQDEAPASDVATQPADPVSTALVEVTNTNTKITELAALGRELAAKYRGVVADVRTVKGYQQIAAIRTELRESVRYPMQKLQDAGSKMLGSMQKQFNARATELVEEVKAMEAPFQEQLDAEDERKRLEKAERDRIEAARVKAHVDAIAIIAGAVATAAGKDSGGIQAIIEQIDALPIGEDWEEFRGQAQQAKDEALRQLNGMKVAALADEAEALELEETRREQALVAEQQAQRQRELEEQEAALQRQREEQQRDLDAQAERMRKEQAELDEQREQQRRAQQERRDRVQQRIDGFAAGVRLVDATPHHSQAIQVLIDAFEAVRIDADYADDRVEEALGARNVAVVSLHERREQAEAREAEEARQQRAAEVQGRLSDIEAMGPRVDESSAELRARLERINAFKIVAADYDDKADDAAHLLVEVAADVKATLEEVAAREQEELEAAERQRQERDRQQEASLRARRLEAAAPRMYDLLKRCTEYLDEADPSLDLGNEARVIINEIDGVAP